MTDYMDQLFGSLGMGSALLSESGITMKFSDIPCEYVVDPTVTALKCV